jgi:hypothetical protein
MNNYDPLMFTLLQRILSMYGMRIKSDDSIVYIHRIVDYTNPRSHSVHIIKLTDDISKAFSFVKMDYKDYKSQQFKNIFEFTEYVLENCPYITVSLLRALENEIGATKEKTEVMEQIDKLIRTIKLGHVVLKDFDFLPVMMYLDLREKIIRNFFDTDDVQNQFIDIKFRNTKNEALVGKFTPLKLVTWLKPLKEKPILASTFSLAFVNYITKNTPERFPRYLVDTDTNIIKREVLSFYYHIFPHSETYRTYCATQEEAVVETK